MSRNITCYSILADETKYTAILTLLTELSTLITKQTDPTLISTIIADLTPTGYKTLTLLFPILAGSLAVVGINKCHCLPSWIGSTAYQNPVAQEQAMWKWLITFIATWGVDVLLAILNVQLGTGVQLGLSVSKFIGGRLLGEALVRRRQITEFFWGDNKERKTVAVARFVADHKGSVQLPAYQPLRSIEI